MDWMDPEVCRVPRERECTSVLRKGFSTGEVRE